MIKSKMMRLEGHVPRTGKSNAYKLLVGMPKGKRPLRPNGRWVDNIKVNLGEIGCGAGDWISLAQDRN
jgi:hypothetical protein